MLVRFEDTLVELGGVMWLDVDFVFTLWMSQFETGGRKISLKFRKK